MKVLLIVQSLATSIAATGAALPIVIRIDIQRQPYAAFLAHSRDGVRADVQHAALNLHASTPGRTRQAAS